MESKLLTAQRFVDAETGFTYRYVHSDTEFFRPHYHDYYEIFLMLDGNALHMVNGKSIPLSPADLVFIRPHDTHDYICRGSTPFSMLNISFYAETAQALFSYLDDGFPASALLSAPLPPTVHLSQFEFDRLCKRMDSIRALPPGSTCQIKTALRMLLFDIFTRHFSVPIATGSAIPDWLEELCSQMERGGFVAGSEYFFSLTDKSREHVSRCMKQHTGLTVSEYINTLRLNYIANMLKNSNHAVTEIIFESGFNNISWACELFKKKYAMTMRQYRSA